MSTNSTIFTIKANFIKPVQSTTLNLKALNFVDKHVTPPDHNSIILNFKIKVADMDTSNITLTL